MAVIVALLVILVAARSALLAGASVRVLREYERGVIFRLGRLIAQKGPGLILLIPIIDRMVRVDLRTVTLNIPPQEVITRDNVPARVNAVAYFRVIDPNSAVVEVENFLLATSQIAQTTLRSVLGKAELDTLLSERERLNEELQQIIDEQTEPWGDQGHDGRDQGRRDPRATMQRAMARQAEAERERRAKIINAEGEFQAAEKLAEAADIITHEPGDAPAALPADAARDRRQPELDDRLPAADRPAQAAARGDRKQARRRPCRSRPTASCRDGAGHRRAARAARAATDSSPQRARERRSAGAHCAPVATASRSRRSTAPDVRAPRCG